MNLISKHEQYMRDLFTHTIGLDGLFNQLSNFKQVNASFPPYNIVRKGKHTFVELALAGYSKDNIEVVSTIGGQILDL